MEDKNAIDSLATQLSATRDAITIRRVFGDAYEVDGTTVIPVARARGGGGGGAGEGNRGSDDGSGFGTGFGLDVRAIGVYEVRDGKLEWKPALDVTRLARGGQLLGALAILCVTALLWRRSR
ncbi:MAG: sporulation protein [Actinomycetia bacterium]|nr:sporulation protein [Actinomycetes bacterium]MCP4222944.1 sporulation protein [Actinomycetes bacterium]MCP5032053.1 sporulation protein [Actinomycetes bacterium]